MQPMRQPRMMATLLVMFAATVGRALGAEPAAATALDHYIRAPDSAYRWELVRTVRAEGCTVLAVDMTSQTWRTADEVDRPEWRHWLFVARPDGQCPDTALLVIDGGSNGRGLPEDAAEEVAALAARTGSVVASVGMVPNQPLEFFGDGKPRYEDDLLAYAWDRFLTTGDVTWIPRLPMVKSAVRAMDTVQDLLAGLDDRPVRIEQFVVAGGSKRGWTTWLTGAVDRRVRAIVPIVIDVLNVRKSMDHHYMAYGFWAPAIGDYVEHNIPPRFDTPRFRELMRIADPYSYRQRLTMPKYIVNASGDEFFLPDSWQFYYHELVGEKHLRYVPNTGHSLDDTDAVEGIVAFYRAIVKNMPRPRYSWQIGPDGAIHVHTVDKPQAVYLWQANAPGARDFRLETIGKAYRRSTLADGGTGRYVALVDAPENGWTAFFVELVFDGPGEDNFKFSTGVHVLPERLPYSHKSYLDRSGGSPQSAR